MPSDSCSSDGNHFSIRLDEGVRAVARILGVDAKKPEAIRVGMPLRAEFLSKGEGAEKQNALVFKA